MPVCAPRHAPRIICKMTRSALVPLILIASCVIHTDPPIEPRTSQPAVAPRPPRPAVAPTPSQPPGTIPEQTTNISGAPDPKLAQCDDHKNRERAFCLSKIEDVAAIIALHDLATETRRGQSKESLSKQRDFVYAAENAGIVAAKTSVEPLYLYARSGAALSQRFALLAMGHALSLLRMGYAHGGQRDEQALSNLVGPVGTVCEERLTSPTNFVVQAAVKCLKYTEDRKRLPALVRAAVRHIDSPAISRSAVLGIMNFRPRDIKAIRPLVRILQTRIPQKWRQDDIWLRGEVCRLFKRVATAKDGWLHVPAKKAAERIKGKNSQLHDLCMGLANLTSGRPGQVTQIKKPQRNWFTRYPMSKCRVSSIGALDATEVCAKSDPVDDSSRSFSIRLGDVTRITKAKDEHVLIAEHSFPVKRGTYMLNDMVGVFELSRGIWLIVAPFVSGVPDAYTKKWNHLLLLDTDAEQIRPVLRTKACVGAGCRQQVQIRRTPGDHRVEIHVTGNAKEKYHWDGKRLAK